MPARHGMKMCNTPEGIARRAAGRRAKLDALALEMYAAYQTGLSIAEVGRRFGRRGDTSVRNLFACRGLPLRPDWRSRAPHRPDGTFAARALLSAEEVDALVESATSCHVPEALKFTWRKWSLAQRADYLARVRARIGGGRAQANRPTGPYSANVTPFDYGSEEAHAIMRAANVGRDSRTKVAQLRLNSEGVIFEGELWFWTWKTGYAKPQRSGPLQLLHHLIWSRAHGGRGVPRGHVLRFVDGNQNNLTAENLRLVTRDELARENQARALAAQSRQLTAALLERAQGNPASHETITRLRHSALRS